MPESEALGTTEPPALAREHLRNVFRFPVRLRFPVRSLHTKVIPGQPIVLASMNRLWGFDRNNKGLKLVLFCARTKRVFRRTFVQSLSNVTLSWKTGLFGLRLAWRERLSLPHSKKREEDRSYCLYSEDDSEAFTKTSTDFKVYFSI